MGLIPDTNVLIRAERNGAAMNFSLWTSWGDAYISAITASELLVGVQRADSEARLSWRKDMLPDRFIDDGVSEPAVRHLMGYPLWLL